MFSANYITSHSDTIIAGASKDCKIFLLILELMRPEMSTEAAKLETIESHMEDVSVFSGVYTSKNIRN